MRTASGRTAAARMDTMSDADKRGYNKPASQYRMLLNLTKYQHSQLFGDLFEETIN